MHLKSKDLDPRSAPSGVHRMSILSKHKNLGQVRFVDLKDCDLLAP